MNTDRTAPTDVDADHPLIKALTTHEQDIARMVALSHVHNRRAKAWAIVATLDAALIVGWAFYQAYFG